MSFPVQGLLNNDINRFYNSKSILHTYNFYVDLSQINKNINTWQGEQIIHSFHITSVDIPQYKFEKKSIRMGVYQYSYPVLAEQQDIDIRLTMEEDVYGRVGRFIDLCQDTIVGRDGYYKSPNSIKHAIGNLFIYMGDEKKESVYVWKFPNIYFMNAEAQSLSYEDNSAMKYVVTFGCDKFERYSRSFVYDEFPNQPIISKEEAKRVGKESEELGGSKVSFPNQRPSYPVDF
jgi:hypothetical protein